MDRPHRPGFDTCLTRQQAGSFFFPALLLLLGGPACQGPDTQHWTDQVDPGGPCYRVNLLDGLDESSTAELRDTFDCLNQGDNLAPLEATLNALESPSRDGIEAGREFARWVNAMGENAMSPFSMVGMMADGIETDDLPLVELLEFMAEILYGESFETLQSGSIDLAAESSLDKGLVRPMLPVLSTAAATVLDENLEPVEVLHDALGSERMRTIAHSVAGLLQSDAGGISSLLEDLPTDLALALEKARVSSNDRDPFATGDSLRDVVRALVLGRNATGKGFGDLAGESLRRIFADSMLAPRIENALRSLHDGNHLAPMSLQLMHFTRVDAQGGSLTPGEDSALVALLRLLDRGNTAVDCNLLGFSFVYIDNLAVTLLEAMAQAGSNATVTVVELLGLGAGFNNYELLSDALDFNLFCTGLDGQMVDDMQALDRFNDPETGDLLEVLYEILDAMYGPGTSRVPEMVDILAATHAISAAPALEEVLRDIGDSLLIEHGIGLLPVLLDPASYIDTSSFPEGVVALDLDDVWEMGESATELRDSGRSGLDAMAPVLETMVAQDGLWTTLENASSLILASDAGVQALMDLVPMFVEWDPELEFFYGLTDPMLDPQVAAPLLRVIEMEEVTGALAASSPDLEGPLAFGGKLVVSGALHSLLVLIDDLINLMAPN